MQTRLAGLVRQEPLTRPVRLIGGSDVAFNRRGDTCVAAIVVMTWPGLELVESAELVRKVEFPYIPGLLSFRELPAIVEAAGRLKLCPDLLLVDGQGRAHPRRLGIASHLGLELDWPTIGCAKSRLVGEHREPGPNRRCRTRLTQDGELIGYVVRTRTGVKPLYVSVGHRIELDEAVRFVLAACRGYRLPEPARAAHHRVTLLRQHGDVDL